MKIFLTNDDGYKASGISVLSRLMQNFGDVTVIAPKTHQSGMGMAVSLGLKRLAYKDLGTIDGAHWAYFDATPASCVKYGLNYTFLHDFPDIVVSGINHGSNASAGACYSGTLGAAQEAVINGVPAIGVSLCTMRQDADFSAVEKFFPEIFQFLVSHPSSRSGIYYNVNFPDIPASQIKGVRMAHMGKGRWIKEFCPWDPDLLLSQGFTEDFLGSGAQPPLEEGEVPLMMVGEYVDDPDSGALADNHLISEGYISIVAHNLDTTDLKEVRRLRDLGIDRNF